LNSHIALNVLVRDLFGNGLARTSDRISRIVRHNVAVVTWFAERQSFS